jgi:hypothetical protein
MRFVFSAMRERVTHMSWPKAGTSGHQTARKPRSSAEARIQRFAGRAAGGNHKSARGAPGISVFNESITMCGVVKPLRVVRACCIVVCQARIQAFEQRPEPTSLLMSASKTLSSRG